jgi:hypothetical protein
MLEELNRYDFLTVFHYFPLFTYCTDLRGRVPKVADQHHFYAYLVSANPDPAFHFNMDPDSAFYLKADPDPAFHCNADPDPAPLPSDGNLKPFVYRTSRAPFMSLQASIVSVYGPLLLYFEPSKVFEL